MLSERALRKIIYGTLADNLRAGVIVDTNNIHFADAIYNVQRKMADEFDKKAICKQLIPE